jgi:hypothetical protein
MEKTCKKCLVIKKVENYPKDSSIVCGYKASCKLCYSKTDRLRYLKNQEHVKNQARIWYSNNKLKAAKTKRNRLRSDINSHLADVLRSRLNKAMKRSSKNGSAVSDLGCTISEFKLYLESKFQEEMNWNNYGKWHIDHIRPLVSFDLSDNNQLKEACNFTNLQPMWAEENWSKGSKWL